MACKLLITNPLEPSGILMNNDIYDRITNLIIERLQAGVVPWKQPWSCDSLPRNGISMKPYRGVNHFVLLSLQNSSPYYFSFQQVRSLGGNVRKGEKSVPVVFWKMLEKEEHPGELKKTPFLRYYNVFNLSQTEGIDASKIPPTEIHDHDFDPITKAEQLLEEWEDSPKMKFNENHAYYSPAQDLIGIPNPRTFFKDEQYYSVLYHEMIHSTGHTKRLGRHDKMKNLQFGSHSYSQEELVAEMGAAFICGMTGIEQHTIENSASYIKSWIRTFKDDPKVLVIAASQAQRAVDYILNNRKSEEPEHIPGERELILEPFEV